MKNKTNEFSSNVHAFALGCLDHEDYIEMLEHFKSNAELPFQELGEYQNLSSLLCSFLIIEDPPPALKDKVARQLYRIKDQKRPDRNTQYSPEGEIKESTSRFNFKETEKNQAEAPLEIKDKNGFEQIRYTREEETGSDDSQVEENQLAIDEIEEDGFKPVDSQFKRMTLVGMRPKGGTDISHKKEIEEEVFESTIDEKEIQVDEKEKYEIETKTQEEPSSVEPTSKGRTEEDFTQNVTFESDKNIRDHAMTLSDEDKNIIYVPTKQSGGSLLTVILFILTVGLIGGVYYLLDQKITLSMLMQTQQINSELQKFSSEFNVKNKIYAAIDGKNVTLLNLVGTRQFPNSFARLFYNNETQYGVLQFGAFPKPEQGKAFQLWLIVDNKFYSGGIYDYVSGTEILSLKSLPVIETNNSIKFIVTEEPITGSETPTGNPIVEGTLTAP